MKLARLYSALDALRYLVRVTPRYGRLYRSRDDICTVTDWGNMQALSVPLKGTLVALEPLARTHADDL